MCVQLYGMDAIMYVWCVDEYAVYINVHVCDIANHYRETTCVVWCVDGYTVYINAHVCDIANSYRETTCRPLCSLRRNMCVESDSSVSGSQSAALWKA